jgi:hypothetical protein
MPRFVALRRNLSGDSRDQTLPGGIELTSSPNLTASICQRLLNHSRAQAEDFSLTLSRYAVERLLYRLAQSAYRMSSLPELRAAPVLLGDNNGKGEYTGVIETFSEKEDYWLAVFISFQAVAGTR